jgi:hypothetical protein
MVMSQIKEIIREIGETVVETTNYTPVVFSLSNAADSIRATPARCVFPMQTGDNEGRDMQFLTLGNMVSITWDIADLMLYKPVKKGSTLQASLPELVDYVGNYVTAFQARKKLGLTHVTLESIDYEWNEFIFPEKSANKYYGVLMMLTIKEIVV